MFILNSKELAEFDLNKAKQFVQYWGKPYSFTKVKDFNSKKILIILKS